MENNTGITQIVGLFQVPEKQGGSTHLFIKSGNRFEWMSCFSYCFDLRRTIGHLEGVKVFPQEPELELYLAKTWDDAKKWFENHR